MIIDILVLLVIFLGGYLIGWHFRGKYESGIDTSDTRFQTMTQLLENERQE